MTQRFEMATFFLKGMDTLETMSHISGLGAIRTTHETLSGVDRGILYLYLFSDQWLKDIHIHDGAVLEVTFPLEADGRSCNVSSVLDTCLVLRQCYPTPHIQHTHTPTHTHKYD